MESEIKMADTFNPLQAGGKGRGREGRTVRDGRIEFVMGWGDERNRRMVGIGGEKEGKGMKGRGCGMERDREGRG